MKVKKILWVFERSVIKKINYFSMRTYMKYYQRYLLKIGINLKGQTGYIDPSVQFDGAAYNLITIGEKTTISKEVLFLVHDYSLNRGLELKNVSGKYQFLKPISIGNNCFVGARVTLLPGTNIGDNCILGAGSVIKGNIPSNSVVCGNPAKVICSIDEWINGHIEKKDYCDAI